MEYKVEDNGCRTAEWVSGGRIFLTGSRKTITRTVYKREKRFFIKWCGNHIEVRNECPGKVTSGWVTVEEY